MANSPELQSFLLIGDQRGDTVTGKLKALGIPYKIKLFESSVSNWGSIRDMLESGSIRAVIARLSGNTFRRISKPEYSEISETVFSQIGRLPHIAFAHEETLSGEVSAQTVRRFFGRPVSAEDEHLYRTIYAPPTKEELNAGKERLARHHISVIPYTTNAELSLLASRFIDDAEKNLLFRLYVPSGRLYAAEAEKLVSLFHEWLQRGGRSGIRRDGYKTAAGQVFEFLGGEKLQAGDLAREFSDFSNFLDLCIDDPSTAEGALCRMGIERRSSHEMVARYSREVRRLQLDLKHERESRMLNIIHSLESEVLELNASDQAKSETVQTLVDQLVPQARNFRAGALLSGMAGSGSPPMVVNVNPQFIHAVESTVLQNIQGTVNLGPEAKQLMELIRQHGGGDIGDLESAVHELEDPDARPADRLTARQRLKAFLGKVGTAAESAAVSALQKYLESKMAI
jgi:hypothetical protein